MDYRNYSSKADKPHEIHPIWRGIGCLLLLVIPVISFASADLLLRYARANVAGMSIPVELRGDVQVPAYGLVQDFPAVLVMTFMVALVLFGALAIVNAIIYSMSGKTRASLNSPPERYQKKRRLK